jgi:predicted nucleotidyltransferase
MGNNKFKAIIASVKFKKILSDNKVKKIAIFGSYARGQQKASSDIDFLVDFKEEADLLDQIGLKQDLEKLFTKDVDVVTKASLNKYIRATVIKEAVAI